MTALASEDRLNALARRFADAERRVRALVAKAPAGDRGELLREALLILTDLRRVVAVEAGLDVEAAYAAAVGAVQHLLGQRVRLPDGTPVATMGGGLAKRLDEAVRTAQDGSRQAFRAVSAATVEQAATDAVTGFVARDGSRHTLTGYADRQTAMIGRRATSIGTRDALGPTSRLTVSGGDCPVCAPHQGTHGPGAAMPPYHPGCDCIATPEGFDPGEHETALRQAARGESLRQWYVERYERRRRAA